MKCLKALKISQFPIVTEINNAITRLIDIIILESGEHDDWVELFSNLKNKTIGWWGLEILLKRNYQG